MTGVPGELPESGTRAFLWMGWGLLALSAAWFVAQYGTNIPVWDDYNIVYPLVGQRPATPGWLWEQCNEHRIAVPKLILLVGDRFADNDVRAGMFLSVATLAILAAALIGLAGRLPGGARPCDAFFPVLLLNLGHATNLRWSIQFAFVLPTAIATALLIPIAARASWPGSWTTFLTGLAMTVLPLCGGTGLVFVPALAIWLLGAAVVEWRGGRPGGPRRAAVRVVAVLPGLVVLAVYFRGFRKGLNPEVSGRVLAGARAGLQFLSCGLGMPTAQAWPWSGAATAGLLVLAAAVLASTWLRRPAERPRVFGLAAFLAGVLALAAAVGWGRGWAGELAGYQDRYVTMATVFWCWLALTLRLYAPPATATLVRNALFAVACVLVWPNTAAALEQGRVSVAEAQALTRDLRSGVPAFRLVKQYTPYLHPSQDEVARILPLLRRAGMGPFRFLRDNPPFSTVPLDVAPSAISLAHWDGRTVHVTGVDPQVTFILPHPRPVAGIRIRYSHHNRQGAPARFQMTWKRLGASRYSDQDRYANWYLPTGEGKETTVWVDDIIDQFRIQPDNQPCEFRIDEIVLLVP